MGQARVTDCLTKCKRTKYLPAQPLGRDLRREDFTVERIRRIADAVAKRGGIPFMSEEARRASLKAMRESVPAGHDAWVFGYGSLMWNPAINVVDSRKAHVRGYHRTFCLTLERRPRHAGETRTDARPSIAAARAPASRTASRPTQVESELSILWLREMMSGAYEPRWVNADVDGHKRTRVLTFVINRSHPRYEGSSARRPRRRAASRTAEGMLGTNRDYLYRTVQPSGRTRHRRWADAQPGAPGARMLANETNATGD